jgi:glycosyltransferase involved in cell wall biosynthesis
MLSWEFRPNVVGGLGKAVTELVPALVAEGADVHLVTPRTGSSPEIERLDGGPAGAGSLTVHRVAAPVIDVYDIYTLAEHTNLALEERALQVVEEADGVDVIHVHDWLVAFSGIALKQALKTPLLATIHATEYGRHHGYIGTDLSRAIHNLEWWLTFEAWRVICCSQFMASEIGAAFRTPIDKVDVIPNGIDSSPFDALEGLDLTSFRAGFATPDEKLVYCVGRVVYEKGAHVLVEAFPQVLARYPKAKLVVTGDGPNLPAAKARAQELGITGRVYFTGFVPIDVRNRLFKVADVAVFPSLYEPFGIVALEAMVARTPVVASNLGGLAEVVNHAETGILVYPNDPGSLAWGVLHTLEHPEWARQRAEHAYRVAADEYNWRAVARRTLGVYERVATERRATAW